MGECGGFEAKIGPITQETHLKPSSEGDVTAEVLDCTGISKVGATSSSYASGNAVAADTEVTAPRHARWIAGPLWSRSDDFNPNSN